MIKQKVAVPYPKTANNFDNFIVPIRKKGGNMRKTLTKQPMDCTTLDDIIMLEAQLDKAFHNKLRRVDDPDDIDGFRVDDSLLTDDDRDLRFMQTNIFSLIMAVKDDDFFGLKFEIDDLEGIDHKIPDNIMKVFRDILANMDSHEIG